MKMDKIIDKKFIMPRSLAKQMVIAGDGLNPIEEEYVWVEGYKGTDKDMRCRDYQYRLGEQFDMPEGAEISLCSSGFHLCPKLDQVFGYYSVGDGNRYFRVMALVPKSQTEKQKTYWGAMCDPDKYSAKSIIFISECSTDEILRMAFRPDQIEDLTEEEKQVVININMRTVNERRAVRELTALGYSEDMAKYAFSHDREKLAKVLASQTNISWDTRILALTTTND